MGFGAAASAGDLHGDTAKLSSCFLGGIDTPTADTLPAARGGNHERHNASTAAGLLGGPRPRSGER